MTTENQSQVEESIHDTIRSAISEGSSPDTTERAATDDRQVSNRDENGRFVSKEVPEKPEVEAVAAQTEENTGTWTSDRPPASWKPAVRELWNDLPQAVKDEITRREENATVGARKLQDQFQPLRELQQHLEPHIRELQSLGLTPQQHIDAVMRTESILRKAPLPEKFNEILRVCDQYGIPLREIVNQSVGQQVLQAPPQATAAIPPELMQEIQSIKQWRDSFEQQQVDHEVETFGSNLEFFGDVRLKMADYIEAGVAKTLRDAYEMATWADPEIRQVLLTRQGQQSSTGAVQQRQVQAASVGRRPSGQVQVSVDDGQDDSISDTIRKAWRASNGQL